MLTGQASAHGPQVTLVLYTLSFLHTSFFLQKGYCELDEAFFITFQS